MRPLTDAERATMSPGARELLMFMASEGVTVNFAPSPESDEECWRNGWIRTVPGTPPHHRRHVVEITAKGRRALEEGGVA